MTPDNVKITNTGNNGLQSMTQKRIVVDFSTFIKSPDKYTVGTSTPTNNTVASKPGDKDYKQLFAKLKMIGEQISVIAAEMQTDPSKLQQLNEAVMEFNAINESIFDKEFWTGKSREKRIEELKEYIEAHPVLKKKYEEAVSDGDDRVNKFFDFLLKDSEMIKRPYFKWDEEKKKYVFIGKEGGIGGGILGPFGGK